MLASKIGDPAAGGGFKDKSNGRVRMGGGLNDTLLDEKV